MRKLHIPLILAGAALAVACNDQPVTGPDLRVDHGTGGISVMSWNVYVGADVDAIILALSDGDPTNDLDALLAGLDELEATDFLARAGAFADEIEARRPHAVGLQEITTFNIDLSQAGGPIVVLDFLPIIEAELAARGLKYTVAGSVLNIDIELMGGLIRMQDYDVLLVDDDRVRVLGAVAKTFDVNLVDFPEIPLPPEIALRRGYVMAQLATDNDVYTVVSTHPEPDLFGFDLSQLRAGQITEIVTVLGDANPAIVMGDLNDVPGSLMYQVLADVGFADVWEEFRPGVEGFTCCHLTDLSNPLPGHTKQLDYILARGIGHPQAGLQGRIDRLGDVPGDKIAGPYYRIWPSDHAGLLAEFVMPPAHGVDK